MVAEEIEGTWSRSNSFLITRVDYSFVPELYDCNEETESKAKRWMKEAFGR
jgi:hypothetical protein